MNKKDANIWITYEENKKDIQKENLTHEEYERRIAELCKRMKI